MLIRNYVQQLKKEFKNYSGADLIKDLMAGLTVAAVALPLALAFGVSSGATAAAGLVTAIIAGLVIGAFSALRGQWQPYCCPLLQDMACREFLRPRSLRVSCLCSAVFSISAG